MSDDEAPPALPGEVMWVSPATAPIRANGEAYPARLVMIDGVVQPHMRDPDHRGGRWFRFYTAEGPLHAILRAWALSERARAERAEAAVADFQRACGLQQNSSGAWELNDAVRLPTAQDNPHIAHRKAYREGLRAKLSAIIDPTQSTFEPGSIIPPWGYDADHITANTIAYLRETVYPPKVAAGAVLSDGTIIDSVETSHRIMSGYDCDRKRFHGVSEAMINFFF